MKNEREPEPEPEPAPGAGSPVGGPVLARPRQVLPPAEEFLYWPPQFQVYGYRSVDQLFAHRVIRRGQRPQALARGKELERFSYQSGGQQRSLDYFMIHNVVAGLLVIKDGEIVLERYGLGLADSDRWSTMSTVKSMSAILVGAALHDGLLQTIDDPVDRYLPEMKGSGYEGVTVRQLLTMSSGVNWNEDYADPRSDVNQYSASLASRTPGGVLALLKRLKREHQPGSRWQYNTGNSYLLGCVLRAAVGKPLADYLSERIWQPAGMEFDAFYTLDCEGGQEIAGSRAGMALRDIGRFAQFVLDDGMIGDRRVLAEGWVESALSTAHLFNDEDRNFGQIRSLRLKGYGLSWWIAEDDTAMALGFAGQRVFIDRKSRLAMISLSAFPQAPHASQPIPDREAELTLFTQALRRALD